MDKIIKKDIVNGVEYKYNGIGGGGSITDNNVIYISQADYDNLTPAEKADTTKNYVIIGQGGIPVPTEIDAEDVNFDNTGTSMQSDNVQDAIEEVFQSVSNGKELLADAITDKGVSTSATDSFATMAGNIESLDTGGMGKVISVQNPSLPRGTKIFSQVTYTNNYSRYSFSDYENYLEDANIYFFQVHREYNDSYYLGGTVMVVGSDGSIQTQNGERGKDWNSGAVFYTLPSDSNTLYIGSVKTGSSGGIGAQYYAIARYNLTTNVLSAGGEERITYYNNGTRTNGEPVTFSGWTTKTVDITLTPENFSSNYNISEYHITNYYAN